MNTLNQKITELLVNAGMSNGNALFWNGILLTIGLVIAAFILDWLLRISIIPIFKKFVGRTKNKWDDLVIDYKLINYITHIIPVYIIYQILPSIFETNEEIFLTILQRGALILITYYAVKAFCSLMDIANLIVISMPKYKNKPLTGMFQILKIIAYFCAVIVIISIIINQQVTALFAGLGFMATVLLLIFKDTILGLVAGVQLSGNDMLSVGDWIEMPKYGADGEVIRVTINTVKVQNWDKTITMIPAYAMVSDSFVNWKGMSESGGRRVKRYINIDMRSVHFCDQEALEKFKKVKYLNEYITKTQEKISIVNQKDDESIQYGKLAQTNLGIFRVYLNLYLKNHPHVHHDMIYMVRQLQPTEQGIPLELYFFTDTTAWLEYESIQADVFDHVLSILPTFDLQIYQNISGSDLLNTVKTMQKKQS